MQEHAAQPFNLFMPLVGVLIGGGLTFGIQSLFRYLDRRRLRNERLSRVHMFTVFVATEVIHLHRHVAQPIPPRAPLPQWAYVLPMVGNNPAHLTYDFDALSVLGGRRNSPVLSRLYVLSLERNASVVALHRYNERRSALINALDPYTVIAPDRTVHLKDYSKDPAVMRIEVEVNSLLNALRNDLTSSLNALYDLEPTYNAMMREFRGRKGEANRLILPPRGIQ